MTNDDEGGFVSMIRLNHQMIPSGSIFVVVDQFGITTTC